ncbi:amidohydrolase [Sphingosinicella microcystinivorans]|uniref:amidohydrolase n=1 Tax=Sphingosinicella microcystinivorans TaxID=335406 RepID=UPI0022F4046C|nr:amidohydrolase [Sphingosinicella microcystinivorans]WBX83466.1 amidohydrolase [Sphingosinicella microcystinivorans]
MKRFLLAAAAAVALAAPFAGPAAADPALKSAIKTDYDAYLGPLFTHFHQTPELSYLETETAKRMAAELKKTGAAITTGVGGTGVVGVMKNGDGPVLLLRADMDGLPVEEKSGLAYASKAKQKGLDGQVYPVMHACGHDTHITAMVGAARRLAAMKDKWKGTILFVVQPAEERVGGAKAMLADGLYTRFPKPDYAVAFHVASNLPTDRISASEGLQYSSADSVDITVHGVGAHGAAAHTGKDPVYIASVIVVALQSIVSREVGPLSPAVITVGAFHAGHKHNIISDRADLQLTVRANDEATRAQLIAAIERVAKNVARANGVAEDRLPEVKVSEGTPTTINDTALARRMNAAFARDLGPDVMVPFVQETMGAEDFAFFVQPELKVPGYYFAVGGTPQAAFDAAKAGGPPVPSHHSPLFKVAPEPSVTLGAEAMVTAALELLKPR